MSCLLNCGEREISMGVQGLWDLVAPAGRRVPLDTLEGKKLAVGEFVNMNMGTSSSRHL